jgi:Alw26I/Eco31I/Esp3I family type II restriction m6 adenine DNA methyltransferase
MAKLYKIFSPEYLLKKPFVNDSNHLNKEFYAELLHIIGLEDTKNAIQRKEIGKRDAGSLLENTLNKLIINYKTNKNDENSKLTIQQFGQNEDEQFFSIAVELCITWLNRLLFLKLLEGQLVRYHRGNTAYKFLNPNSIQDFDDVEELFFEVLALPTAQRNEQVKHKFGLHIPYLNSSLFEITTLEHETLHIANLKNRLEISIYDKTVLKNSLGKKITGTKKTLQYLLEFLDAYNFGVDNLTNETIHQQTQEQNKTLISASVLGLIFEKINGYKDGSFFTPSFITMYMCREAIRKAVVQKFNENGFICQDFEELKDILNYKNKEKANEIINTVKICDPAVGSGHFLVSALNELIVIKSELNILCYLDGSRIQDYKISVENDELLVVHEETDEIFVYCLSEKNTQIPSKQKLQEALFHAKQTLIENCLFGVDINPKSTLICRLRLWIELLKNAYYKANPSDKLQNLELQTLPNIDINIKTGNSLLSRFDLQEDLSEVFKEQKFSLQTYKNAVETYKKTSSPIAKIELLSFIKSIKEQFRIAVRKKDKRRLEISKLKGDLLLLENNIDIFGEKRRSEDEKQTLQVSIQSKIAEIEQEIANIEQNSSYQNAFEWRFEFPEILNIQGEFEGFDLVIGNPPYLQVRELPIEMQESLKMMTTYYETAQGGRLNLFQFFVPLCDAILKPKGNLSLIYQNSFLAENTTTNLRKFILNHHQIIRIDSFPERDNVRKRVFEDVKMSVCITHSQKNTWKEKEDKETANYEFPLRIWEEKTMQNGTQITYSRDEIKTWFPNDWLIPSIATNDKILLEKMLKVSNKIAFQVHSGELDMAKTTPFFTQDTNFPLVIKGSQVQRYYTTFDISQGTVAYLDEKKFFAHNAYSDKMTGRITDCETERIVIQRITGVDSAIRLVMTLVQPKCYCANSVNYIKASPQVLRYLLAILNSKLINKFYKMLSTNTNITAYELEKIPIPNLNPTEQQPFIDLVDAILQTKKEDENADTTVLEQEIDRLVENLYGV